MNDEIELVNVGGGQGAVCEGGACAVPGADGSGGAPAGEVAAAGGAAESAAAAGGAPSGGTPESAAAAGGTPATGAVIDGAPAGGGGRTAKGRVILPGATIGVLGGGQLGRMLAHAGSRLGYRFVTLDPTPDSPCGQTAAQIVAGYADREAARELARRSDVITYEFENVDAGVAAMLEAESYVPQGSALLHTTQHRLREKRAVEAAGARVAPYDQVASLGELAEAAERLGLPAVLKTAVGGYDGKGQWVLRTAADLEPAWAEAKAAGTELVLEKFVDFAKEISVIAARRPSGEIRTFPPAENIHVNNILHLSIVPARIDGRVREEAEKLAVSIARTLGVVGLIAVEMFVGKDGELYVNELAPRPHNSGHYTIEAARTSQFEQHIRAICDLPLGDPSLLTPVVMANLLGEHVPPLLEWMGTRDEAAERLGVEPKVHLYGKAEAKARRKMGHVNVLAPSVDAALKWIAQSNIWRV